jgi:hypothetical protein
MLTALQQMNDYQVIYAELHPAQCHHRLLPYTRLTEKNRTLSADFHGCTAPYKYTPTVAGLAKLFLHYPEIPLVFHVEL